MTESLTFADRRREAAYIFGVVFTALTYPSVSSAIQNRRQKIATDSCVMLLFTSRLPHF